jgi:hypothetical protein
MTFGSHFVGFSYSGSEWCVFFFVPHAHVWIEADLSLCDLADAWNQVRWSLLFLLIGIDFIVLLDVPYTNR